MPADRFWQNHCTWITGDLLTHSTEHNSSEKLIGYQLVKKFPTFYENRRFVTTFTSARTPVPILSQLDPVHALTSYFLKIHLNIIFPSTPRSSKLSFSLKFLHLNPVYVSPHPHTCYMPRPSHASGFDHPNNLGEQYRSFCSSLLSFLESSVASSLLGPNIPLNTLFSNTLSLCSSFNVSDQVSHP